MYLDSREDVKTSRPVANNACRKKRKLFLLDQLVTEEVESVTDGGWTAMKSVVSVVKQEWLGVRERPIQRSSMDDPCDSSAVRG